MTVNNLQLTLNRYYRLDVRCSELIVAKAMAKKAKTRKSIAKRIKITGRKKMVRRNIQGKYKAKDSGVNSQENRESKQIHSTDIRKIKDHLSY